MVAFEEGSGGETAFAGTVNEGKVVVHNQIFLFQKVLMNLVFLK